MTPLRSFFLVAVLAVSVAAPAGAQPARYRAPADTVASVSVNRFHLFWVHGADTVGVPQTVAAVQRQLWRDGADGFDVEVTQRTLDPRRDVDVDTLSLTPAGRVVRIDGRTEDSRGRWDFLPRFPADAPELRPGLVWTDTLSTRSEGGAGETVFRIERRWRVAGTADTLGVRALLLIAEGSVRYADAFPDPSGATRWMDVSGPVGDTVWIDPGDRQPVARRWRMELRGRGGEVGGDTVSAGLLSSWDGRNVSTAEARLLDRPLPEGDTTYTATSTGGTALMHVVARDGDDVHAAMARADGMVGTVHATFAEGRPTRYRSLWTSLDEPSKRWELEVREGTLHGGPEGPVDVPPNDVWAVADYGMDELLLPALRSVPTDGRQATLAVFRPFAGRWDRLSVTAQSAGDATLVRTRTGGDDGAVKAILFDDRGLLYAESSNGSVRAPAPGSPRMRVLEETIRRLNAGG